jgi:hypothetical protein
VRKINTILLATAAGLFLISAFTYRDSVQRAERFERGQKFLPNLNPDEIAEILITKGGETTQLQRQGDEFVLVDQGGYPAKIDAVNRFVKDVLGLSLENEIGRGEALEKELELTGEEESTIAVTFEDAGGKEMVHFLVGKAFEDGGNYVRRANVEKSTIYLTGSRVYFSTDADDFLKKDVLDVKQDELAAIEGDGFRFEDQDGSLALLDVPAGMKEKTSEVNKVKGALSYLRFTSHHLADAPEVRSLAFTHQVTFDLQDDSGYVVEVAESGDKHYLRVQGFHRTPQVQITMDADEEEVKEKSEILARGDEINEFNEFHGSWIYEVSESTADKFRLSGADLLEKA